jgi:hypothetical protein
MDKKATLTPSIYNEQIENYANVHKCILENECQTLVPEAFI